MKSSLHQAILGGGFCRHLSNPYSCPRAKEEVEEEDEEDNPEKARGSISPLSRIGIPGARESKDDENNHDDEEHIILLSEREAEGKRQRPGAKWGDRLSHGFRSS